VIVLDVAAASSRGQAWEMLYSSRMNLSTTSLAVLIGWTIGVSSPVPAAPDGEVDDGWPAWVREQESFEARIAAVNEGELDFLERSPAKRIHQHRNRVRISEQSLRDGWVTLSQCHEDLDQVAAAQIVFNPGRSRDLRVTSYANIEQAYAQGNTVQLRGIGPASTVCIEAESQALRLEGDDVFELVNGPFMRRFLDGYYPLHLTLTIDHPESIVLADFSPDAQPGFAVSEHAGRIDVEALFEGELRTRFRFLAR
jgi:hypothetical protein